MVKHAMKEEPMEEGENAAGNDREPTTEKEEYADLCSLVNEIASPLANRKLAKKIYKLVRKSSDSTTKLRTGMKDVSKALRKNETGIVLLAGNVSPIDIYSHVPAICEEKGLPYVYTPSKEQLGLAVGRRRPVMIMLIKRSNETEALFDEISSQIEGMPINVPN